ncbi:MAG: hypothetical protein US96_C0001G0046 [Candidatus Woesebacteria bacterium GW2011_GWB1_38_5b]|uniref:UDP-N-acetylglucosamine--N-acetylmuramyl-(pentapeptide) pyrophosphoryl-undecaprenol N-acetylglucosamine transferase n=1 Tax=Candidatus Woesebacteria bacterium GW2011_GWB1_38_5b TaxID=1618569 RepID=A0A0G0KKD1_9BACT|nr:MAG: hypothetical protein US96_C0001G0046 [Candidatus Woesebacteria bacterium GW2011_GWB1_38_5b]
MKSQIKQHRIIFCGAHAATTALSVIQELIKRNENGKYLLYWIGAKSPIEGKRLKGIEHTVFPGLGVTIHEILTGRIQRRFSVYTLPSLAKIPLGFVNALFLLLKIKPHVILSFGGYSAFPVVVMGRLMGVPVILHEQTVAVGLANKFSSFFVNTVAIAREESRNFFPKDKTLLVGNPLMSQIVLLPPKSSKNKKATMFVTGGSRGSQQINNAMNQTLKQLLEKFVVLHQAGEVDYKKFKARQKDLGPNYYIYSTIDPIKIPEFYKRADIVVGRAGANTVSEIIYLGIPSILIPIPWTRFDEQTKNAKMAEKLGVAKIITQDELNGELLFNEVVKLYQNWDTIVKKIDRKTADLDSKAAATLADLLEKQIHA